ncbi:G patch domain-containing protein 3 [Araneus ventricosus]|uniref:G patch domain-containing protein 3 n=1 Tax=Araneus ventricosus TaxID=182803 RepID=A0A4Y2FRX6_ARAVE|nr:G patch domain-containing protein 3 [Araneus ventricosus]
MSCVQNDSGVYVIINNIPKNYRCNQLRHFFSSFVESGGFICFHYIHRPEVQKSLNSTDGDERRRCVSNCCIVKVVANRVHELIKTYNEQHWLDGNGETLPTCCYIKELKLSDNGTSIHGGYKWAIPRNLPADLEFSIQEVESFPEMRPRSFMPNGNVGTITDHFLKEIRMCRLPPRVIRKLGLLFPRSQARRIYSSAFDFMSKKDRWKLKKKLKSYVSNSNPFLRPSFHNRYCHSQLPGEFSYWEDRNYKGILYPEEEGFRRYEALHDDVYGQERLGEEKIGLKWKKGRSGLFFYPDTQYWDAKEGYFDAKTSNDWGIDTRIYEEPSYKWAIPKNLPADREEFSTKDVESLLEMHPPSFMPNGNVETTTDNFLKEIRMCRLPPPPVIYKLDVKFPRSQARGIYSSVAFDCKSMKDGRKLKSNIFNPKPVLRPSFHNGYWHSQLPGECSYWENVDYKEILYPEEEEWHQYEALHDHVYGQEGLGEEKIGLKWNKGGSDLVFYPGAQYWNAKEGYFDARTSDDWAIDTRIYEEPGMDNKRDLVKMKLEERRRNGTEAEVDKRCEFAGFEKYNKVSFIIDSIDSFLFFDINLFEIISE